MRYTEFIINSELTLKLRLTLESMVMLERRLGESPLTMIARMGNSNESWNRNDCISILNYALISDHTLNDVFDIYDLYISEGNTDIDLANVLVQLIKDSGFLDENKDENNSNEKKVTDNNIDEKPVTLEESLKDLLEKCMARGIEEDIFWTSTYGEITRRIKAIQSIEMDKAREKAIFDYKLSELIGLSMSRLLSKDATFPSIEEIYPNLFDKNDEEIAKQEEERKVAQIKARLMGYMTWHNNKMEKKRIEESELHKKD